MKHRGANERDQSEHEIIPPTTHRQFRPMIEGREYPLEGEEASSGSRSVKVSQEGIAEHAR